MIAAGVDIGSRTIALAVWDGVRVLRDCVVDTGPEPLATCRRLLEGIPGSAVTATGYGRHLVVGDALAAQAITEIKAHALGARQLFPEAEMVVDIGGQDSKVILLRVDGAPLHFEMNDRCAAGTGRFLESMARTLGLGLEELGPHALEAPGEAIPLSSTCTVFAESEVVSLIGRGENSRRIALGIHQAIVTRIGTMVRRVGLRQRVVLDGGVALNPCVVHLLASHLGIPLCIPSSPQTVGALGAALHAWSCPGL